MALLEIKNLNFTYPEAAQPALSGINLEIQPGEFVLICGASGCGKSTLLRQCKPALSQHGEKSGAIYFNGKAIEELSFREQSEKIGFVMQDPEMQIVTDKVRHELAFGLESLGMDNRKMRVRIAEMASFSASEIGSTALFPLCPADRSSCSVLLRSRLCSRSFCFWMNRLLSLTLLRRASFSTRSSALIPNSEQPSLSPNTDLKTFFPWLIALSSCGAGALFRIVLPPMPPKNCGVMMSFSAFCLPPFAFLQKHAKTGKIFAAHRLKFAVPVITF